MSDPVLPDRLDELEKCSKTHAAMICDHDQRIAFLESDDLVTKARTLGTKIKAFAHASLPWMGWLLALLLGLQTLGFQGCHVPWPIPTPPAPPVPPVPPVPPAPPAPIPGDGLRVLIIFDKNAGNLPPKKQEIIYGGAIRDYLNAKCPKGKDGKTGEWRIYDKGVDAAGDSKIWQDAIARPRTELPWLIVSNGKTGYEGPFPADVPAALELLKKYGGP